MRVYVFLSTLSLRRATALIRYLINTYHSFYPRSPCGERLFITITITCIVSFLSTLSLRRATVLQSAAIDKSDSFYPRSPCGERRWLRCWQLAARDVSIHALLAESDIPYIYVLVNTFLVSIHALLAESDYLGARKSCDVRSFYPRSPCGERLCV